MAIDEIIESMDRLFFDLKTEKLGGSGENYVPVGASRFDPISAQEKHVFPVPVVSDIINSREVSSADNDKIRKITDVAFRYLIQLEFFDASVEIGDMVQRSWEAEKTIQSRIRMASSLQHQVISSRIALECFFDLIKVCGSGERFRGRKGKFISYKKWVTSKRNIYSKFAPLILVGWRFDRMFRSPEVHGTSKLHYAVLHSELESSEKWKIRFALTNGLRMSWGTLLDILNDREGGMWTSLEDGDITEEIFKLNNKDSEELETYLKQIFEDRMTQT